MRRYVRRSELRRAGAFGDVDAAQGKRPEAALLHLPHQRCEVVVQVGLKHLDADLVAPRRPAVPFDRQEGLSHQAGGDPPGERVYLDFAHGEPITLCNQEVRTRRLGGMFLSVPAVRRGSLGFPPRERAGQFRASAREPTFLMDLQFVLPLPSVFPFTLPRWRSRYSGSAAALKEEAA